MCTLVGRALPGTAQDLGVSRMLLALVSPNNAAAIFAAHLGMSLHRCADACTRHRLATSRHRGCVKGSALIEGASWRCGTAGRKSPETGAFGFVARNGLSRLGCSGKLVFSGRVAGGRTDLGGSRVARGRARGRRARTTSHKIVMGCRPSATVESPPVHIIAGPDESGGLNRTGPALARARLLNGRLHGQRLPVRHQWPAGALEGASGCRTTCLHRRLDRSTRLSIADVASLTSRARNAFARRRR